MRSLFLLTISAILGSAVSRHVPIRGQITSHEDVQLMMATLSREGIILQSVGKCDNPERPECTSLHGVQRVCLAELRRIKRASGCSLFMVVGGTEVGHGPGPFDQTENLLAEYDHGHGWKIDIEKSECLSSHIINTYGSQDGVIYVNGPFSYHDHNTHWDIQCTDF